MFEDKIKEIEKLSELEILYFDISNAIFIRETKELFDKQIENFSKLLDLYVKQNNINLGKKQRSILEKNYEILNKHFFEIINILFSCAIDAELVFESEQCINDMRKNNILNLQENLKKIKNKQELLNLAKQENLYSTDYNKEIEKCNSNNQMYNSVFSICKLGIEQSHDLREKGFKYINKRINEFEVQSQSRFFNDFMKYILNINYEVEGKLLNNINLYIDNFNNRIELRKRGLENGD